MSKVFVLTPTYCTEENRRLPLLLQTIYWIQQQTHKDYLHIIVDDESTDSTPEVLERLSRFDPNLKVFRKENAGSSAAINYGVEQALALEKPDYITVCHSDDVLLPESLDVRVKLALNNGAELVYTDEVVIYDTGLPPKQHRALEHSSAEELYRSLLQHQGGMPYATMLWGADFFWHNLQGYDNRLTSSEDWDIALRSAKELVAVQATHATSHDVTVAKREHKNRLRIQNLLDGTKQRCYEVILQKHLLGDEYQAAMARERFTKLRQPRLLGMVKWKLAELLGPKLFAKVLQLTRRASSTKTDMDPLAEAFLKEMDNVDYGLMDDRAG